MWTPSIKSSRCIEVVALIVGGSSIFKYHGVEAYKPSGWSRKLSDLPEAFVDSTVDYLNGFLYLCGHVCFRGEYMPSRKGKQVVVQAQPRFPPWLTEKLFVEPQQLFLHLGEWDPAVSSRGGGGSKSKLVHWWYRPNRIEF